MNKNKILLIIGSALGIFLIVFLLIRMKAPNTTSASNARAFAEDTSSVSFWVSGDAMMHMPQYNAAMNHESGQVEFDSCYTFIRPILKEADVRIINFETTLAGPKYTGYPRFSAPNAYADAIVRGGFNFFAFANNHSCDRQAKGMEGNLDFADSAKIWNTGIFRNAKEREELYPLILNINGWKIAVINCTYATNKIPAPKPYIVNYIDTAEISKDISKAKAQNVDAILAVIHWGAEYQHKPNSTQKATANFLLREGVDVIIGSHPHIVQPVEFIDAPGSFKDRLVIWSLGNFISNQKDPYTDAGLMVGFTLKKSRYGRPEIADVQFVPFYRYKCKKKPGYFLMPSIFTENHLDKLIPGKEDQEDFKSVMINTRKKMDTDSRITEYNAN